MRTKHGSFILQKTSFLTFHKIAAVFIESLLLNIYRTQPFLCKRLRYNKYNHWKELSCKPWTSYSAQKTSVISNAWKENRKDCCKIQLLSLNNIALLFKSPNLSGSFIDINRRHSCASEGAENMRCVMCFGTYTYQNINYSRITYIFRCVGFRILKIWILVSGLFAFKHVTQFYIKLLKRKCICPSAYWTV